MQRVTIDGIDKHANITIKRIVLWKDYENRIPVKHRRATGRPPIKKPIQIKHGERVDLLEREGEKCKVRDRHGHEGYVTWWFIKEIKEKEWDEYMKKEET